MKRKPSPKTKPVPFGDDTPLRQLQRRRDYLQRVRTHLRNVGYQLKTASWSTAAEDIHEPRHVLLLNDWERCVAAEVEKIGAEIDGVASHIRQAVEDEKTEPVQAA